MKILKITIFTTHLTDGQEHSYIPEPNIQLSDAKATWLDGPSAVFPPSAPEGAANCSEG